MDIDDNMTLDQAVPRESKYLTKDDVGEAGVVLTIAGFSSDNVAQADEPDEIKTLVKWVENHKPLVLNQTNKNRIKELFPDCVRVGEFKGKVITVYNNPEITFGGKTTGGIRIKAAAQPASDIPF